MGASGIYTAIRRLFRQQKEVYVDSYDFKHNGVRLFSSPPRVLPLVYRPGLSVRDVCEEAAQKVGILPINLPFFTLVTVEGGHVLNLQKNLTEQECKEDYEFRFIFKGCTAARFADSGSKDDCTLEYLFCQCQYDFLGDRHITFPSGKEGNTNFAKLVICEIIHRSRQKNVRASEIVDKISQYGIQSLLQRGIFSRRSLKETKKYLKEQIPKIDRLDDYNLKKEYIHTTEQANDYFVHKFIVNEVETNTVKHISHNVQYELQISSRFGIKRTRHADLYAEMVVENFIEIDNLKIDQVDDTKLTIFRTTSRPLVLFTSSLKDAQSIVALIDGYYKLHVNRYKSLINQERPSVFKIHGPISRKRAESKVQENGTDDGLYLLRRCSDDFNEYRLTLFCKTFYHYKIVQKDGLFMLKDTDLIRTFQDLNEFMTHYETTQDHLECLLMKNCPPSLEGYDALLDNQSDAPASERPQDLTQFDLERIELRTVKQLTVIGKGEYGNVIKAQWTYSDKENPLDIAIRKVQSKRHEKEFFNVEKRLIEIRNPNVIRCYGILRMKDSLGLAMEFAPYNLEDYLKLKSSEGKLTRKQAMIFAAQIAEGMMFLQEMKCVHGRLCAHNILVAEDENDIKISDVGLLDLKKHGGKFFPGSNSPDASHCWYAPEWLINTENFTPTHESDIWSLGVTIWEIFTLRKPFHVRQTETPQSREQVLNILTIRQEYLELKRKSIPEGIAAIIKECWDRQPEKRISFEAIMTQFRKLFIQKDLQDIYNALLTPDQNVVESWEQRYDDENVAIQKPAEVVPVASETNSYSILAADQPDEKEAACKTCLTGPHHDDDAASDQRIWDSLFCSVPRKQSFQRRHSDPVSPTVVYEEPYETLRPPHSSCVRKSYPLLQSNDSRQTFGSNQQINHPEQDPPQQLPPTSTTKVWEEREYSDHHFPNTGPENYTKICTFSEKTQPDGQYVATNSQQDTTDSEHDAQDVMKFLSVMLQQSKSNTVSTSHDVDSGNIAAPTLGTGGATTHQAITGYVKHDCLITDQKYTLNDPNENKTATPCANTDYVQHNSNTLSKNNFMEEDAHCDKTEEINFHFNKHLHGFIKHHLHEESSDEKMNDLEKFNTFEGELQTPGYLQVATDKSASENKLSKPDNVALSDDGKDPLPPETDVKSMSDYVSVPHNPEPVIHKGSDDKKQHVFTGYLPTQQLIQSTLENIPSSFPKNPFTSEQQPPSYHESFDGKSLENTGDPGQFCVSQDPVASNEHSDEPSAFPQNPFNSDLQHSDSPLEGLLSGLTLEHTFEPEQSSVPQASVIGHNKSMTYILQKNPFESNPHLVDYEPNDTKLDFPSNPFSSESCIQTSESSGYDKSFESNPPPVGYEPNDTKLDFPSNSFSSESCIQTSESSGYVKSFESNPPPVGYEPNDTKLDFPSNPFSSESCIQTSESSGYDKSFESTNIPDHQMECSLPSSPINYNPFKTEPHQNSSNMIEMNEIKEVNEIPQHPQDTTFSKLKGNSTMKDQSSDDETEMQKQQRKISSDDIFEEVQRKHIISKQNLSIDWSKPKLGEGKFGVVRSGQLIEMKRNRHTKVTDVAIKELSKAAYNDYKSREDFIKEAINMSKIACNIKNDSIIRFIGVCIDEQQDKSEKVMIVTELAPHGDLRTYLQKSKKSGTLIPIEKLVDFCSQICSGMVELERRDILHRDLALRNILVKNQDQVKISDFGLSRLSEYYKSEGGKWPLKWYAPESLAQHTFTSKSDVWSFGITMWEIFSYGDAPYPEVPHEEMYTHLIMKGERLSKPDDCPDAVYELMQECWLIEIKQTGKLSGNSRPSFYNLHSRLKQLKQLMQQ